MGLRCHVWVKYLLLLADGLQRFLFLCVQSSVCNTIEKVVEAFPDKLSHIIDEMKQILTPMAQK